MSPAPTPALRPFAAVLFDAVGTLFELAEPVGVTYARFARSQGVRLPADRLGDAFERVLAAAAPNLHPGCPADELPAKERAWWYARVRETVRAADQMVRIPDFQSFFDPLFDHFASAHAWCLCSSVDETLAALAARGVRLGVVSNFDGRLPDVLRDLGILEKFEVVVCPGDVGATKPDPRPFAYALERLAVAPAAALYVGDRPDEDLAGAGSAGLRAIHASALATLLELPALDTGETASTGVEKS